MTPLQVSMILAVVAAAAAMATWRGVAVSRNQPANQAGFEIAKRLLERVLKLESMIRSLRVGMADEDALWAEIDTVGNDIDQAFGDGHALWGDKFAALKPGLKSCVGDLKLAKKKAVRCSENFDHLTEEQVAKVWDETAPFLHVDEPDPFADRIRAEIKKIEKFLEPHLRRRWRDR